MIEALLRKSGQVAKDATLRRWLLYRALGKTKPPAPFTPHHPPYLSGVELGPPPSWRSDRFKPFEGAPPTQPIRLALAGLDVVVEPDRIDSLFQRSFADIEQLLALHRFAWVDETTDPAWVAAIWRAWLSRYESPNDDWPWHPYTAAERLIAILDVAQRHGWPEPAPEGWACLCAHGFAIVNRLEYFGEHYTGNHLANNGRGLFRLGIALGWKAAADIGSAILINEAARIFGSTGVLREGSSHYHLLLAKNYSQAAQWAAAAGRNDAKALDDIAAKARYAAGGLLLTGGLALIGDISPDLEPARLSSGFARSDADLSLDGWFRFESGDWSLIFYVPPDGWPPMPGHGHQDLGGFELHWRGVPLIVDPGRGSYGETGDAAYFRSAAVHNGITFRGRDPRPLNRPYYADDFRKSVAGRAPLVLRDATSHSLRFTMQGRDLRREFKTEGPSLLIEDFVQGGGSESIERRFVVPHPLEIAASVAVIKTPAGRVRLSADAPFSAWNISRWTAYGRADSARQLILSVASPLPWHGRVCLEPL